MYTFLKISHVVCLQFQARAGSPSLYVSFSYIIFRGKLERKICLHIQYISDHDTGLHFNSKSMELQSFRTGMPKEKG